MYAFCFSVFTSLSYKDRLDHNLKNTYLILVNLQGGGHWGILEIAKPKKKIIQNRKTAKKFGQN